MKTYKHKAIEKKWQKIWEEEKTWEVKNNSNSPNFYVLDMFPYPSAEGLHVGHPEGYTASDIMTRYHIMKGNNVLHPMGFDSFGLPAENYAIKTGTHPVKTTAKNIENMRKQIKSLGFAYDWSREVITSDPKYYKWTQWIFIQLFKKGLAYEANAPINWCPSCKTGLANEEVVNGKCERCSTEVTKKQIRQWLVKITDEKYIERLLNDLDDLDWPDSIKHLQRNWIGRSEGAMIKFQISSTKFQTNSKSQAPNFKQFIEVFTTRPDTLFGVTYMVLSPEHELVDKITTKDKHKEVHTYQKQALAKSDLERTDLAKVKTGVFTGAYAINPVNDEKIPIWIADYVLSSYGTGAIMAVPAHDQRDNEFAKKYDLPIVEVVVKQIGERQKNAIRRDGVFGIIEYKSKVLILYDKKFKIYRLPGGGYENEENSKSALIREIKEETGYINFEIKEYLGQYEANYVAIDKPGQPKRHRYSKGFRVLLTNEDSVKRSKEETDKFEMKWFKKEEILNKLEKNPDQFGEKEFLIRLLLGKHNNYIGDGVAINSGEFNGLKTIEFKKKITEWLEKNKVGKKAVNYKLRDWLFSRQRYWGEPIPIVHCESCKKDKKKTILIIHGTGVHGRNDWYGWLADELRSLGHEVIALDLPNPDQPVFEEWITTLEQYQDKLDENSVVIGHSLGGFAGLHLVTRLKKKINKLILVAPTHGDMDWKAYSKQHTREPVENQEKFHQSKVIYDKVYSNTEKIIYFYADNDFYLPSTIPELYKKVLKADYRMLPGRDHFNIDHGKAYTFPELFEEIVGKDPLPLGTIPVPEKDLPVELPDIKKYEPTGTGESPLAAVNKWVNTKCPECGGKAKRETNTMPQWAGSNWYFLRYCDPHNDKVLADPKKLKDWLPVNLYIGGAEHAVLHLLYARFIYKFLFDIGVVPKEVGDEPFKKLKNQGLIMGEDGVKMSKSRGNVINPDDVVKEYGADTLRMYEMFMGPFEDSKPWDTRGIIGIKRFLDRVWDLQKKVSLDEKAKTNSQHVYNASISNGIEKFRFNTCISDLMKWSNEWKDLEKISKDEFEVFIKLLYPFAPHMAEEIWVNIGHKKGLAQEKWPEFDQDKIKAEVVTVVVQVNGKLRDNLELKFDVSEEEVKGLAMQSKKVKKYLIGEPKKVIFVKNKLINFVV